MKILISYPPLKGRGSPMLTQNRQFQWYHEPSYIYPVVMASVATNLQKQGHTITWNDCIAEKLSWNDFISLLFQNKPDILILETKTPVVKKHWQIIRAIKKISKKTQIILVGDHVTALPQESMKSSLVDFIVTGGNYDVTITHLIHALANKKSLPKNVWYRKNNTIRTTGTSPTPHLALPSRIDRILTKAYLYGEKWKKHDSFFYTMAGRDCWWKQCTFCSWTTLYPIFHVRSPQDLLDEIGVLIEKHKAKEIFDDTGTFPVGNWLKTFCKGMIERGYNKKILFSANMRFGYLNKELLSLMKKAGFRKLKIGLESGNQKTLDRLHKGIILANIAKECEMIKNAGIAIHLTVMVGYPWETEKDALNTYTFVKNLMEKGYIEMLQSTIVIPYPGTPLYKEAIKKHWFTIKKNDYDHFDMTKPILKSPDMSPEKIEKICRDIYTLHFKPKFIMHRLQSFSFKSIKYYIRGIRAMFGHYLDFS